MGYKSTIILVIAVIGLIVLTYFNMRAFGMSLSLGSFKELVLENSSVTKDTAMEIRAKCGRVATGSNCFIYETMTWVDKNIKQHDDDFLDSWLNWNNDVKSTREKGGDCENVAIYTASVWKELGYKDIYILYEEGNYSGHAFAGVVVNERSIIMSNYLNGTIEGMVKVN